MDSAIIILGIFILGYCIGKSSGNPHSRHGVQYGCKNSGDERPDE